MASSPLRAAASWSARSSMTTRRHIFEAQGYPAVKTLQTQADVDALRAERDATIAAEADGEGRARRAPQSKTKKAIAGTVRAQRADYWEDVSGRYISIEGTTTEAADHPGRGTYSGPALHGGLVRRRRHAARHRPAQPRSSTPTSPPRAYLYHGSRFRVGNVGDGGMPRLRADRGAQRRRRHARRQEVGRQRRHRPAPAGSSRTSTRTTSRRVRATPRCASSPTSSRTSRQLMKLPNKTNGYQRKAQADRRHRPTPYNDGTSSSTQNPSIPAVQQPQAVVLTSQGLGPRGRQQPDRGDRQRWRVASRSTSPSRGTAITRPGRDRRRRRDHEHGRAGRGRDQRLRGRRARSSPPRIYRTNARRGRRRGDRRRRS